MISDVKPLIIALNETRHDNNFIIPINGYEVYEKTGQIDNGRRNGGVATYIKSNLPHKEIKLNTTMQAVAVEVEFPFKHTVLNIYLPPNENVDKATMGKLIDQVTQPVMLVGDMNAKHIDWGCRINNRTGQIMRQVFEQYELNVLNDQTPTRTGIGANGAYTENIIDLVVCNAIIQPTFSSRTLIDKYGSDHRPVTVQALTKVHINKAIRYNYNKGDWNYFDLTKSIDNINDQITNRFKETRDVSIPTYTVNIDGLPKRPWWSKELKTEIKLTKKLARAVDRAWADLKAKENYKIQRSKKRKLVKEAKQCIADQTCEEVNENTTSTKLWNVVRAIEGKRKATAPITISVNGINISDKKEIANLFGEFFQESFAQINNIENLRRTRRRNMLEGLASVNKDITMFELENAIKTSNNTSPGHDGITYEMLKKLNEDDKKVILDFYNKIWRQAKMPQDWKKGVMVPIPKSWTDREKMINYRPIQMLSVLSKTLEKIVAARLNYLMESEGLTDPCQNGFRRQRSVTDNLMALEHILQENLTRKKDVICIFYDIKKAYDSVSRTAVMNRLNKIGVSGRIFDFIEEFMRERKFVVKIGEEFSQEKEQEEGVTQGSGLSVQIFKTVMDALREFLQGTKTLMFADDFVTIYEVKNKKMTKTLTRKIKSDIEQIIKWAESFGMEISHTKTKVVRFSARKKANQIKVPKFKINGNEIEQVKEFKFLGVNFDEKLTFKTHLNMTATKAAKDNNILRYLGGNKLGIRRDSLLKVLNTKTRAILEYGNQIMRNASPSHLKRLNAVYNQGLRICMGACRTTPVASLYNEAGVDTLERRREMATLKFTVKVLGQKQHFLHELFNNNYPKLKNQELKRKVIKRSAITWAKKKVHYMGIDQPLQSETFDIIPSWEKQKFEVDISLHLHRKDELNPPTWRRWANKIEAKYRDRGYEIRYTDGSKIKRATACAIVDDKGLVYQAGISQIASIYTAEQEAVSVASILPAKNNKVAVLTDSSSTAKALLNRASNNITARLFRNRINESDNDVVIAWIPSHQGLPGNESADEAAKMALNLVPQTLYTVDDALNEIKSRNKSDKLRLWLATQHGHLRKLKDNTERSELPKMTREEERKISRLRLGKTIYHQQHIFHGLQPMACMECLQADTIEHIFDECPRFRTFRNRFNIRMKDLAYPNRFKDIISFLKTIEMYDKI